jgi:hypothetical protein
LTHAFGSSDPRISRRVPRPGRYAPNAIEYASLPTMVGLAYAATRQ